MDANDNQILTQGHRQLQQFNQQMESLLQHIAMEDSTCDTYRDLGKALRIITDSINMTLTYCNELSRVPETPTRIEFVLLVPCSEEARAFEDSESEQPDFDEVASNDAGGLELPRLEDLTALLSLIQRVSEIVTARCHYFNRRANGILSSLVKASNTVVRERRYVSKLQPPPKSYVEWLRQEGPLPPPIVDPEKRRISLGGSEHGRTPEDRG